ncbi:hypothetical protein C8F01DRAFT_1109516 [Mycena amicta]|nr:hypothetical protein C8F01DRAFT_1109516 [Mycena amicta]
MEQLTFLHPPNALFRHPELGVAHSWYYQPLSNPSSGPVVVLVFIPGNPGLLEFYSTFLSGLRQRNPRLAIFAHAHLAHTPGYYCKDHSLAAQVQSAIEALDAIRKSTQAKVILAGHSVGAWISLQVLKARPDDICQVQLLFPTITHIAQTPNGRRLSWLFRSPFPRVVSWLSYLTRPLPISLLFAHWPDAQLRVLRSLLNSPSSIYACLSMAHDEMAAIHVLDQGLLKEHRDILFFLFGTRDDWVAENKSTILRCVGGDRHEEMPLPHAFCIEDSTSEAVAVICSQWVEKCI